MKTDPLALALPVPAQQTVMSGADIVAELALATGMLVVIVALHGLLLTFASRRFSARFTLMSWSTPRWQIGALMSLTVAALVAFHLMEALVWTLPLYGLSIIETFRDAFSYVLEAYTTLGESIVVLPPKYRLVGPVIAISGLFTFGWTGSALVYVMGQILRLEARRARQTAAGKVAPAELRGPFGL